jgi:hypothetical protein
MAKSSLFCGSLRGWTLIWGVGLALGKSGVALAQVAPAQSRWDVEPGTLVYLDGERSTVAAIDRLAPAAISTVEGSMRWQASGDSVATNVLVVTTKANASAPAVLALADKAHLMSGYISHPSSVQVIAPKALAYITSHYPKCWLGGEVLELTQKSTGTVKYRVQLADNWGFRYASFTLAGDFVDDRIY